MPYNSGVRKTSHNPAPGHFTLYSNTSDDALGLDGALADLGSTLSRATDAILITSWLINPQIRLLLIHDDFRDALRLHRHGNKVEAITQYLQIKANFPSESNEHAYANFFIAIIHLEVGNIDKANFFVKEALKLQPKNPQFVNYEILLLYLQGDLAAAMEKAKLSADANTDNVDFLALCGDIARDYAAQKTRQTTERSSREQTAKAFYLKAIKLKQNCYHARRGLGKLLLSQNKLQAAQDEFQYVLNGFPYDAVANEQMALIALKENRFNDIIGYFNNALRSGCDSALLWHFCAQAYIQKCKSPEATEHDKQNCLKILDKAISHDVANFTLHYQKASQLMKMNRLQEAKNELEICASINPKKLGELLPPGTQFSAWRKTLDLPNKISLFARYKPSVIPAELNDIGIQVFNVESLDEFSAAPLSDKQFLEKFPLNADVYWRLANQQEKSKPLDALNNYLNAASYSNDIALMQQCAIRINKLRLSPNLENTRLTALVKIQSKIRRNHAPVYGNFYDAYTGFREQLPTLAELLITKAIKNPDMVIALQLWDRSSPSDFRTYKDKTEKVLLDAYNKLFPHNPAHTILPSNVLLRFTRAEGFIQTHHQKYVVVDTGDGLPTAFYGSCDLLALAKFDWSDHQLINTVENGGVVAAAFGYNEEQNYRAVDNDCYLRFPWRETVSCVQGPAAVDLVDTFDARWQSKDHGVLVHGMSGAEDQGQVAKYAQNIQTKRSNKTTQDEGSVVVFQTDTQFTETTDNYIWTGQLLLSTPENANVTDPGFFGKNKIKQESSILEAMRSTIQNAERYIYIESQYFTATEKNGAGSLITAMIEKIADKYKKGEPFHIYINLPYSPNGDPGPLSIEEQRALQWKTMTALMRGIEEKTGQPWNHYVTFAFFAQWHGATEQLQTLLNDDKPHTRGELMNASLRCPIYNHGKLMIADDSVVINGSANFNERSLQGDRDTECAIMQKPAKGCEKRCQREIATWMREKIIRPYYGEEVDALLQQSDPARESFDWGRAKQFSNRMPVFRGKFGEERNKKFFPFPLGEHEPFVYTIFNNDALPVASLRTSVNTLYAAYTECDRQMSHDKMGSSYLKELQALKNKTLAEKLALLIEHLRKCSKELAEYRAFCRAFYELFQQQCQAEIGLFDWEAYRKTLSRIKPNNNMAIACDAQQKEHNQQMQKKLEKLDNHFGTDCNTNTNVLPNDFTSTQAFTSYSAWTNSTETSNRFTRESSSVESHSNELAHLPLESPSVVQAIQTRAMANYHEFANNEPGHASNARTGKVVAFPFVMNEVGRVGEIEQGCERIPDAPKKTTNSAFYDWIPKRVRVIAQAVVHAFNKKFKSCN